MEKDAALQRKVKTIGNYVDDSVPISDNEVTTVQFVVRFESTKIGRRMTTA